MLDVTHGLSPDTLGALADLERRTVEADGGRLKLEWGVLRERGDRAAARAGSGGAGSGDTDGTSGAEGDVGAEVLWWDADRLVGFAGLYAFGAGGLEIAGMVDPDARRRGIATALLDTALPLGRDLGYATALLVTPRDSPGGAGFARGRGAVLEHSEHALALAGDPADGPADPRVTVRAAGTADVPELTRLLTVAFGWPPGDVEERLSTGSTRTLVITLDRSGSGPDSASGSDAGPAGAVPVGTLRVTRDGDTGGVYGFAVDPAWQGRGIGRDALRRVCRQLRSEGVRRVTLEVAVDNEHALGLYTSLGFARVTTEDYWVLPTG